jgi:hypothetical protein
VRFFVSAGKRGKRNESMKMTWAIAAALMLIVGLVEAGQGEICSSSFVSVTQAQQLTNDTKFTCPSLGEVTIPEIYQLGWRIAHLSPQTVAINVNDPLNSQTAWMILIEMP